MRNLSISFARRLPQLMESPTGNLDVLGASDWRMLDSRGEAPGCGRAISEINHRGGRCIVGIMIQPAMERGYLIEISSVDIDLIGEPDHQSTNDNDGNIWKQQTFLIGSCGNYHDDLVIRKTILNRLMQLLRTHPDRHASCRIRSPSRSLLA